MIGLPWRLAFALQADGWWLRQDNVWAKPAPMPESVNGWRWERCRVKVGPSAQASGVKKALTGHAPHGASGPHDANNHAVFDSRAKWADCPGCPKCAATGGLVLRKGMWRTTRSHEYVFQFAKSDSYYCDAEAAKEAVTGEAHARSAAAVAFPARQNASWSEQVTQVVTSRNPRSVLTIGPDPFREAHFATWPRALARKIISWSTSERGCCATCGAPWVRVVESCRHFESGSGKSGKDPVGKNGAKMQGGGETGDVRRGPVKASTTVAWLPSCDCLLVDPVPCTIIDPFGGSGRTAQVAEEDGRNSIIVELNPEYVEIAKRQTEQRGLFSS